jgi:hypothetical protein
MKITKTIIGIIAVIFFAANLQAQESTKQYFPGQVSFVHPIGTSGTNSPDYQYNFSLNILTGSVGGINGLEIGGLMNSNAGDVIGMQVAGIGNITKGDIVGMQVGGIISTSKDVTGMQVGGILSTSEEVSGIQLGGIHCNANNVIGMQTGGISSISKNVEGIQIGGIICFADTVTGAQLGGITNKSKNIEGLQIGGISNINTGNMKGLQIAGLFNKTQKLNGVQIGLINIADTVENGIAIGLINICREGYYDEWELSTADNASVRIAYKTGQKRFYNIFTLGTNYYKEQLWFAGFGFGHITDISENISFQPELLYLQYFPYDFWRVRYTSSQQLKLGFTYYFGRFGLSVAPSIGVTEKESYGENSSYELTPIKPIYTYERYSRVFEINYGLSLSLIFR